MDVVDKDSFVEPAGTAPTGVEQVMMRDTVKVLSRRARGVGLVITLALGAWLASLDTWSWRLWAALAVAGAIAASFAFEHLRPNWQGLHTLRAVATLAVPLTVAVLTGGIESPVLVALPAALAVFGVGHGQRSLSIASASACIALVVALAALRPTALGEALVFEALFGELPAHAGRNWTVAAVIALATVVGSNVGLILRRRLDEVHAQTVRWQREAAELMADRNQELQHLSGALAHELKNPLTAIQGLSTLMADKAEPGSHQARQLEVMVGEVRRMGATLEEFLGFARPTSPTSMTTVDLARLLDDVVQVHEGLAAERGVRLETIAAGPTTVLGDDRKLKQIVVNLVRNAIEATPTGGHVRAVARGEGTSGAVVEVADEGDGVEEALLRRVFSPGVTTRPDGSGLGLTIARSLAEQHGGEVSLTNDPAGGCRARLTLPARPPTPEPEP